MKHLDIFSSSQLAAQIRLQRTHAWDLDTALDWSIGVDLDKILLPLDDAAIAFPGASGEQRLVLSQLMGLIVNSTISEMEDSLPKLRFAGWKNVLDKFPVNPEMVTLGELFFEEEAKHAKAFQKYLSLFVEALGVDYEDLDSLLPKAFGSNFQNSVTRNAEHGGHAFWWVVASVEEVSVEIFKSIFKHKDKIDPLYFQLHRRHLEEEARHANYAFLMLQLLDVKATTGNSSWRERVHQKVDFLFSQLVAAPWVLTELAKVFRVRHLRHKHPFFEVLASCLPLLEKLPKAQLLRQLFMAAPYISWILNPNMRTEHKNFVASWKCLTVPFPKVSKHAS